MIHKEQYKQLPDKPGVYMMCDSLGNIIYVGKAKNLKKRVAQYFVKQKGRLPKIEEMVGQINFIEYITTDTELEALIEECRLIQQLKPIYNRQMKNYQKYVYIIISKELFPRISIVDNMDLDGLKYFGPFNSPHLVEAVVRYLEENYPLRKCPVLKARQDGCLYKHLGKCLGVCTGRVTPVHYHEYIEKVIRLLDGTEREPLTELKSKMDTASQELAFEQAAKYKEQYLGLKHVIKKQKILRAAFRNSITLAIEFLSPGLAKIFLFKGNTIICKAITKTAATSNDELKEFIKNLIYTSQTSATETEYLTKENLDLSQIIYTYIQKRSKNVLKFKLAKNNLLNEAKLDATLTKIAHRIMKAELAKGGALLA